MAKRKLIFKNLAIENFKCHKSSSMNFEKNKFILLTGPNGSGKTSYIDAIAWALYDETTTGNKGDAVIRKKDGKNCSVILTFSIDKDEYEIRKYRKHKTYENKKFLIKNGIDISQPESKDTTREIEKIIMEKDIFFNCLLFSQFINKSFVKLTHAGQKEILDKMLSFEKYDTFKSATSESIKSLDSQINVLLENNSITQGSIASTNSMLKSENEELILNRDKLKEKIRIHSLELVSLILPYEKDKPRNWEKEITTHAQRKDSLVSEKSKYDEKVNSLRDLCKNEIGETRSKYEQRRHTIDREHTAKYNEDIKELDLTISETQSKLSTIKIKYLEDVGKLLDNFNRFKDKIRSNESYDLERIIESHNELMHRKTELARRITSHESTLEKISDVLSTPETICPKCNQTINNENTLSTRKATIASAKESQTRIKSEIPTMQQEINNIESSLQQLESDKVLCKTNASNDVKKHFTTYTLEVNKIDTKHNTDSNQIESEKTYAEYSKQVLKTKHDEVVKSKLETITSECDADIESIKQKYKTIAEEYTSKIAELAENISSEDKLIMNILSERDTFHELKNHIISVKNEIKTQEESLKNIVESSKVRVKKYNELIKECNDKLNANEKLVTKYKNDMKILSFWVNAFGDTGIKSILLDEAIPILNEFALNLSTKTQHIRVSFDSQKMLKSGDLRSKFEIRVDNTKNLSELAELSAGETRLANIIILLSLRHLLEEMSNTSINLLLLDEILDSLDEDNAMIAIDMIKELSKDYCIMLITHTLRSWIQADEEYAL